jgi:transposase
MAIEGYADQMIAQVLGVSKSFIRDWKKAFNVEGIAGIKLGYQGAKGKLTVEQKAEIIEWLRNKGYWHLDELINHLEDKYDVVYKLKQKITCILFAPNAPQQNPVEDIWLQAKNFLRKYWYLCKSFWAIKNLFELFYDCSKFDFSKIHQYHFSQEIK